MVIASVGSSSSGNSYIIATENSTIILDVGLPAKRIVEALYTIGREPEVVDAVLITHEHTDHVKSVRAIGRQCSNAVFYASRGTVDNTAHFQHIDDERIHYLAAGDEFGPFDEDDIEITAFALSHDAAEPLGFTIRAEDEKLAVVTDCGIITDEIFDVIKDADILIFEANHDEDLLMYGAYPYFLKQRIKSDVGHLSNRAAGELLADVLRHKEDGILHILLAHLSQNNNVPFRARETIEEILDEAGFERDIHYTLEIASASELTLFRE